MNLRDSHTEIEHIWCVCIFFFLCLLVRGYAEMKRERAMKQNAKNRK